MYRFIAVITAALFLVSTPVEAKTHHSATHRHSPAIGRPAAILDVASLPAYPIEMTRQGLRQRLEPMARKDIVPSNGYDMAVNRPRGRSVSLSGLVGELVSKVKEIQEACGSIVVSAFRAGAHIPTGQISNHAIGRAADLQGNPACIYAHLQGWPGGYSVDYNTAPGGHHVHISYNPGGMEWGARFVHHHGGSSLSAKRHHHSRVASR